MGSLDPATEYLRLLEHYREMSDCELIELARRRTELTDVAQQALGSEVSRRRLEMPPQEPPPPTEIPPEPPYSEERELVELCTVWSREDALQLQQLLEGAGIPMFLGGERATSLNGLTLRYDDGVVVQVMRVGLPWARQAMRDYTPKYEPASEKADVPETPVRCPKCESEEIVFDHLTGEIEGAPAVFHWTCDSCGHEWEDDGVAQESSEPLL